MVDSVEFWQGQCRGYSVIHKVLVEIFQTNSTSHSAVVNASLRVEAVIEELIALNPAFAKTPMGQGFLEAAKEFKTQLLS